MSGLNYKSKDLFHGIFKRPSIDDLDESEFCDIDHLFGIEEIGGLEDAILWASEHEWFHDCCCNRGDIPNESCDILGCYDIQHKNSSGRFAPEYDQVPLKDRLVSVVYSSRSPLGRTDFMTLRQIFLRIKGMDNTPHIIYNNPDENRLMREMFKKDTFPVAKFTGAFPLGGYRDSILPTGLICINLDQVGERLSEYRSLINAYENTLMSFRSVDGDGLRVIFEANPLMASYQYYYKYYSNLLREICGIPLQGYCNYLPKSQFCYLQYDPEAYLHFNLTSI